MHECAYQCVRPVLVYPLVWILPFMATAQLLWLLWMMLHPPMASYVIYASILPWIHRNEAWIDEISLWALGAWIFISNQYRRLFNGYDLPRRNEGDSQEALEVDVSLCIQPDERKDQLTPSISSLQEKSQRQLLQLHDLLPSECLRRNRDLLSLPLRHLLSSPRKSAMRMKHCRICHHCLDHVPLGLLQ